MEMDPFTLVPQSFSRDREGIGILVEADQPAGRREDVEDGLGVSARADGAVEVDAIRTMDERLDDLPDQNRFVPTGHGSSYPPGEAEKRGIRPAGDCSNPRRRAGSQ